MDQSSWNILIPVLGSFGGAVLGAFIGRLVVIYGEYVYLRRKKIQEQVDNFYAPINGCIKDYELAFRNLIQTCDCLKNHYNDNSEVVLDNYKKDVVKSEDKIFELISSKNYSCIEPDDYKVIQDFRERYSTFRNEYGSDPYPQINEIFIDLMKLPDDFIEKMNNQYKNKLNDLQKSFLKLLICRFES